MTWLAPDAFKRNASKRFLFCLTHFFDQSELQNKFNAKRSERKRKTREEKELEHHPEIDLSDTATLGGLLSAPMPEVSAPTAVNSAPSAFGVRPTFSRNTPRTAKNV